MDATSSATKQEYQYTVFFEPAEEGGYVVRVPALPGCFTQGETFEEAKKNIQEAIECYLLTAKDMGHEIPVESNGSMTVVVGASITLS